MSDFIDMAKEIRLLSNNTLSMQEATKLAKETLTNPKEAILKLNVRITKLENQLKILIECLRDSEVILRDDFLEEVAQAEHILKESI